MTDCDSVKPIAIHRPVPLSDLELMQDSLRCSLDEMIKDETDVQELKRLRRLRESYDPDYVFPDPRHVFRCD